MSENDAPAPEMVTDEEAPEIVTATGSRLPVPVRRAASYPAAVVRRGSGLRTSIERLRPAWPVLARGAATAATLTAAGLVVAKAGPRLLQRVPRSPSLPSPTLPSRPTLPGRPTLPVRPSLPVAPEAAGDLVSAASEARPDLVIVTRELVRWTRTEVYRYSSR